jgi:PTS system N-acetylglucosamine-specific IIC component
MNFGLAKLQMLGKALMLPVAVLPAAALLLRLGAPDVFNIPFITKAGSAVFENLALIFAVGIGTGIAKDNNGAAGLSGAIGYLVMTAGMKAIDPKLNMSVLAGIICGVTAGVAYNRFHTIQLPQFLGFFAGRRFVPIVTALIAIVLAGIFSVIWGPCQTIIQSVGHWIIGAGALGVFIYGILNRLLIPLGLHHILNSFVWFVFGEYTTSTGKVVTGDLNRFFAGDPTAGIFMSGFYFMMMFGLPAAAFAMYRSARPENRKAIAGMLASVAFTSFLTGITEPLEFMFMFLSPVLYGIHAFLTGCAMATAYELGILHGFGFSAGFIDYVLNWGLATKPILIIPVGLIFAVSYYGIFTYAIRHFNLTTPGRINLADTGTATVQGTMKEWAVSVLAALGGKQNLKDVSACITRLRLETVDNNRINEDALMQLGAKGIIKKTGIAQVVIGTKAEALADAINAIMQE